MTRVSDKSSSTAVEHALNKTKLKLEDLQIKGSSLKRLTKPSDDPIGNIYLLQTRTEKVTLDQFVRNANMAVTMLEFTENSVDELSQLIMKAKEMAIAQSSDIYNSELRKGVAKEVGQMVQQAISIGNRRMGSRYIFGGYKTDTPPFASNGEYKGDNHSSYIEVMKDFFVPVNFPGSQVFHIPNKTESESPAFSIDSALNNTEKAEKSESPKSLDGIITQLQLFNQALITNDTEAIQSLLNRFDSALDHLVIVRTQIGSNINTIKNAENIIENENMANAKQKSQIEDADLAEIYSDLAKQQNILKAVYKTSSSLLDEGLIRFLK